MKFRQVLYLLATGIFLSLQVITGYIRMINNICLLQRMKVLRSLYTVVVACTLFLFYFYDY